MSIAVAGFDFKIFIYSLPTEYLSNFWYRFRGILIGPPKKMFSPLMKLKMHGEGGYRGGRHIIQKQMSEGIRK